MDYHVKLLLVVAVVDIFLSFFVLRQNRSRLNLIFSLFVFFVGFWSLGVGVFIYVENLDTALFAANLFYLAPPLIVTVFFYFSLIFLGKKIKKIHYTLFLPFGVLLAALFLNPNFILSTVFHVDHGLHKDVLINKINYIFYAAYVISYIVASYVILFRAKYFSANHNHGRQLNVIIVGTLTSYVLATIFNLLLPFLGNYQLIFLGPLFTLIMVCSIAYAILKYNLFNIKLILVEIALIILNFILFVNIFLSQGVNFYILNTVLFAGVGTLSTFLIRGIYKDIRDRERIEGLVKDMAMANKRLFALEQQKTEFVSIASHQLRAPMTVIKGYASMVLEGAFGLLPKEAKEAMEKLYKSTDKIVVLVDDLLTVSRIEQGRGMPIFETINFVSFMQELLVPVAAEMRDAGLKFSFDIAKGSEAARVLLDKKKFEQALRHIIGNAIKYTKAPGLVNLTISNDTTQHRVYLSISDTGIGMTQEQVKTLMEKSDIKASARKGAEKPKEKEAVGATSINPSQKASGIGFYIAQEIINAHYGSLRIESLGQNKGATVIIELPELE